MNFSLWPRRRLGKTALTMAVIALLLIPVRAILIRTTGSGSSGYFFSNPPVEILNITIWLAGSGAFVTGVGALSYRDRAWTVLAGSILGFAIFLNGVIRMMAPP